MDVYILKILPKYIYGIIKKKNKYIVFINNIFILNIISFLKLNSNIKLDSLMDITVTDFHFNLKNRFELLYSFWSTKFKIRMFIKFFVNDNVSSNNYILSLNSLFHSLYD